MLNILVMSSNKVPKLFGSGEPKTYKHNQLNTADFGSFTQNSHKVFLYLITKIGGVDEFGKYLQPDKMKREHVLTVKEFQGVFNTDIHNTYKTLKQSTKHLMKSDITLDTPTSYMCINVCSRAVYNKKEGSITIKFTDDIMPYLAQVNEKFVMYNLKEVSNFKSLYTTRLYELIQEFKETGWMTKSIEQLRKSFAVNNKFKLYADFKRKTFEHACNEINNNYKMGLRFEEIKRGRKVVAVKFIFKKTRVTKRYNQHTGIAKNVYEKPKALTKQKKHDNSNVLEEQLSFKDTKKEAKPIKNVLSSLFSKFTNKD